METNKLQFPPIEKEGLRVLTTLQLAEAYGTNPKIITKNFNRNKERYIEGVHYFRLTGEELKNFCANVNLTFTNSSKIRELYLWTERGALLHAKSLNTEKAWEVYEFLIDNYYRAREIIASQNNVSQQQIEEDKYSIFKISTIVKAIMGICEAVYLNKEKIKELNEENEKLKEKSQMYYEDIYFLKEEVKVLNKEIEKLQAENRDFKQMCKKNQAKINFLKEDFKELKKENKKLTEAIREIQGYLFS